MANDIQKETLSASQAIAELTQLFSEWGDLIQEQDQIREQIDSRKSRINTLLEVVGLGWTREIETINLTDVIEETFKVVEVKEAVKKPVSPKKVADKKKPAKKTKNMVPGNAIKKVLAEHGGAMKGATISNLVGRDISGWLTQLKHRGELKHDPVNATWSLPE